MLIFNLDRSKVQKSTWLQGQCTFGHQKNLGECVRDEGKSGSSGERCGIECDRLLSDQRRPSFSERRVHKEQLEIKGHITKLYKVKVSITFSTQ